MVSGVGGLWGYGVRGYGVRGYGSGGQGGLVVKRPPGNQKVGVQTPPQPPGRNNEKWTLG